MKKQLELQEEMLHDLEQKYDETTKIRHDIKNHVTCALNMAYQYDCKELISYLYELSNEKINMITNYIPTNRKIIGAVLNSKLAKAKEEKIDMNCCISSELENIKDIVKKYNGMIDFAQKQNRFFVYISLGKDTFLPQ